VVASGHSVRIELDTVMTVKDKWFTCWATNIGAHVILKELWSWELYHCNFLLSLVACSINQSLDNNGISCG
jgi:hypothetical protein